METDEKIFGLRDAAAVNGDEAVPFDDDDDLDAGAEPGPVTTLDEIRAELTAEDDDDLFELPVPKRPGYSVKFSTEFPQEKWEAAQKAGRSKRPGEKAKIDAVKAAAFVLNDLCRGIFRHGEPVMLDGKGLIFGSRSFLDLYEARSVHQALRAFYKKDGHLLNAAERVLDAAGWGDVDFDEEDPIRDPS